MKKHLVTISFFLLLFTGNKAIAQQTIFNVPSPDVLDKGKIYLNTEAQFNDDFASFTNYFSYGVGKNTELDATLIGVGTNNFANEVLGLGFKSFLPLHKDSETKLTFGFLLPISLRGDGVGGYQYAHLSTVLPKLKTRITSGYSIGTTILNGRDVFSFLGAIEQPITKRLDLILEWTSGKFSNGLLIAGAAFKVTDSLKFEVGYQIPNNRQVADDGFVIEIFKYL